jgi:hypothetical protein
MLAVLFVAIGAPKAHAETYDANFTCNNPCTSTPTSPGVTFVTVPGSTDLLSVTWELNTYTSPTFQLTDPAGRPTDTFDWSADVFTEGGASEFNIFDLTTGEFTAAILGFPVGGVFLVDFGGLTLSPTAATPEPSSLLLLGTGLLGLAPFIRSRFARR